MPDALDPFPAFDIARAAVLDPVLRALVQAMLNWKPDA